MPVSYTHLDVYKRQLRGDADLGSTRGRRQRRAESADGGRPDPGGGEAVLKIKN